MSNKKSEKHNLSAMLSVRRELSFDIRQSAVIKALNTYLISVMYQYLIIHTIISPYMTFNIDRIVQRAIITQHTVDMIYHSFKVSHTQPVGTFMLAGFAFLVIILWTGIESREWSLYQGHSDRFGVIAAVQLDVCHNAAYKIFSTHDVPPYTIQLTAYPMPTKGAYGNCILFLRSSSDPFEITIVMTVSM